jgi:NADPH:quinone reductase-like Zn-dependent oxidoreductase
MTSEVDHTRGLELRTLISPDGTLRLWLEDVAVPVPAADEVVVRVEAAPINPSDIMVLLGPADLASLQGAGTTDRPEITATVPAARIDGVSGRVDQALSAGNEGAGTIVAAGHDAQDLPGVSSQCDRLGCMPSTASSSSRSASCSPREPRRWLVHRPSSIR